MSQRSSRSQSLHPNDAFLEFTSSVGFDHRLWRHDIAGSIAHAHTLANAGVVTRSELDRIILGLRKVAAGMNEGGLALDPSLEDIHMNVESRLMELIGDAGAKIHTGRSRNDQVALDMRLIVRELLVATIESSIAVQETLKLRAVQLSGTMMPGYTHVQHAQPVLLTHHLLAHFWRLQRDIGRLQDCYKRANISPLGSGALAGTWASFDRSIAAKMLGMDGVTENSLDGVADRDFVAETAFALSLLMIHLSSLCEELVLWSSHEFGFIKLPQDLSGGSSMMPQKRNPDIPELVRGKSGRAVGDLVAILTLLKSLPLAYNRDLQEDKESLFDVFDTAEASLHALRTFLAEAEFNKARMRMAAEAGLMTATDLADLLTTRGVPFRRAHRIVSELAAEANGDDKKYLALARDTLMRHSTQVRTSDMNYLRLERAIERRGSEGGTSKKAVALQLAKADKALKENVDMLATMRSQTSRIDRLLGL